MHVIVCASMCEFRDKFLLRRGEWKTQEKFNFSEKRINSNCRNSASGKPGIFLDLG